MGVPRVLGVDGKFYPYKGPAQQKVKVKDEGQKIAERKDLEAKAKAGGFLPENPVKGGLSEKDIELIKAGMTEDTMKSLSDVRGVSLSEITGHLSSATTNPGELSEEIKEKIRAGVSIPEMRKMAKDAGIAIPGKTKKAVAIKEFLLAEEIDL